MPPVVIANAELNFGAEKQWLGSGANARVYGAVFRHQQVAVKEFLTSDATVIAEVQRELEISRRLLGHQNVVSVFGVTLPPDAPTPAIVMERLDMSLAELLHHKPISLMLKQRLAIVLEVARALVFCGAQQPPILHRDIKSANVLLSADARVVKLGDFGSSRFASATTLHTANVGTAHYMSPEVLQNAPYGVAADVFSFGVLMWETLSRSVPYAGLEALQVITAVCLRGERPAPDPPLAPASLQKLIKSCWAAEAHERPPIVDVFVELTGQLDRAAADDVERAASETLCCVCMEEERTHAMVPCGHRCACASCAAVLVDVGECPLCRSSIQAVMKVHM
jgi:serine/threonine protein kinase